MSNPELQKNIRAVLRKELDALDKSQRDDVLPVIKQWLAETEPAPDPDYGSMSSAEFNRVLANSTK